MTLKHTEPFQWTCHHNLSKKRRRRKKEKKKHVTCSFLFRKNQSKLFVHF